MQGALEQFFMESGVEWSYAFTATFQHKVEKKSDAEMYIRKFSNLFSHLLGVLEVKNTEIKCTLKSAFLQSL